jgi:hypothetical protein
MKLVTVLTGIAIFFSINSFGQTTVDLDDQSFCRTIISDGLFGQPRGERKVCITFEHGKIFDGSDSLGGMPSQAVSYIRNNNNILVERDGSWEVEYKIDGDTITSALGAVLIREKINN